MKTCSKCKQEKPLTEFYKDKNGRLGVRSVCSLCDIKKAQVWNKLNPDRHANHEYKHRTSNPETVKENKKRYVANNLKQVKASSLQYNYGISLEDYEVMLQAQNSSCAICGTHQDSLSKSLCVDHDHDTGKVRGLLCNHCNSGIGFLNDSVTCLEKAILYLKRYRSD